MKIIVVGPSCVGKSTLGRHAQVTIKDCRHFNLDELVKERQGVQSISQLYDDIGKDEFLKLCLQAVNDFDQNGDSCSSLCLFDLGAGGMQSEDVGRWLGDQITFAITCDPAILYPRYKNKCIQSFENFKILEYSARHIAVYGSCTHRLDVSSLTEDESKNSFVDILLAAYPNLTRR